MKPEDVEKVLLRGKKVISEASALDLAKLLSVSHLLVKNEVTQTMGQLKEEMMLKLIKIDDVAENDIFYILEHLPAGSYKSHREIIDQMLMKVFPILAEVSSDKLISAFFGIYNSGGEIPFKLVLQLDGVSKEFLKKLSPETLCSLGKILAAKKMLSEDLGRNLIDV